MTHQPTERALVKPWYKHPSLPFDLDWLYRWAMPEPNSGCMLWLGGLNDGGYGTVHLFGRKMNAHRAAFWLANGREAVGLDVDHNCRVRCCVNPAHLEAVPHRVNIIRGIGPAGVSRRQRAITHCPAGHPYNGANTMIQKSGARRCRICGRASCQRYAANRKLRREAEQ